MNGFYALYNLAFLCIGKPAKSNLIIMHIILLWKISDHAYCLQESLCDHLHNEI